ncbi:MAG: DAK2 domain-containing protein [Clostridiales bacterium]|nr:DAK2 domain-containing protein [Clostridiales bacterium]
MKTLKLSGAALRDMFLQGAAYLEKCRAEIDALNVFPVPDGDTGSNMSMTMQGAVKELRTMPPNVRADEVADAVSRGALRGARGNSGVILSQLFRGFARALKGHADIDAAAFANGLTEGTHAAYKAVMKPKEGTILTVSRLIADASVIAAAEDPGFEALLETMLASGRVALANTPNLLPVLKEAGVVDSGGKGLLTIYIGFLAALSGEDVQINDALPTESEHAPVNMEVDVSTFNVESIEYGYCTEFFIVRLKETTDETLIESFRNHLIRTGDSVVVASDEELIKVHVHSNAPGKVLQLAMQLGELDHLKIENMREQNRQLLETRKRNEKEYGIVAVSCGEGMDAVFRELGANQLISGGQTMNPSIDTIVHAIRQVNARNVFVLPNNGNIILAAEQAKDLCDCQVFVLPTKTLPQGISTLLAFNPDADAAENAEEMADAIHSVLSGAVTYAVRDTQFAGKQIGMGDIIGLIDNDLSVVEADVATCGQKLLSEMIAKKGIKDAVVTIFYGEDVEPDAAQTLADALQEMHASAEFIVQHGGQPLYYYYFSVE